MSYLSMKLKAQGPPPMLRDPTKCKGGNVKELQLKSEFRMYRIYQLFPNLYFTLFLSGHNDLIIFWVIILLIVC